MPVATAEQAAMTSSADQTVEASRIFTPFRALGYCSNHVPLCLRHHVKHNETYVVTCVGRAFHTYNTSKLGIVSVSNSHPEPIRCMAANATLVFTACDNVIRAFSRGRLIAYTYEGHENPVHILLPFGEHLISVDEESSVRVWDIGAQEVYMELAFENASFQVSALVHPSTYVNKVLLGSQQGELQLWNIRTAKLLYTFYGWGHAVTVLEQAPAIDVIAIGLANGDIVLHNVKFDETVVKFHQDWGPVTAISFRTDGNPVMTTGSPIGHIAVWDLEKRKLAAQMREAHWGAVTGMKCLPSQPLMVTSSSDNSLKVWIFDQTDGSARLLRDRSGHSAPPTKLLFHGTRGDVILSAGQDSTLRLFSTKHERHNKSFGRASYNKAETKRSGLKNDKYMMPPITAFTSESSRESDWDSIVACHRGERLATTWNYDKTTMGKYKLQHERFKKDETQFRKTCARCCTITSCGNFCVLGYSSGHVDVYNMQSGLHRGSFGDPKAHDGPVRGVNVDGLNQCVITAGADALVNFWRFKQKTLISTLRMESPVADVEIHRESSLVAVILDDFSVSLVDLDTKNVVRRFHGHENRITDLTFSNDARWMTTSSIDCTIRTWDIPTGSLLDAYLVDNACTSLCFSTNGEYLATSHVDDLGVYLWSNQTLYEHKDLRPLPKDFKPRRIEMPSSRKRLAEETVNLTTTEEMEEEIVDFKSPEQISDELVTLSLLPNSRWQNLLNLDVIRQRNKPKEPPRAPKAAPFFIPTISGLETKFAPLPLDEDDKDKSKSMPNRLLTLTNFGRLLDEAESDENFDAVLKRMEEMGPSAIDTEIRSLSPDQGGSVHVMSNFLKFIRYVLSTNRNFQIAQAYLGLFLKIHGDEISKNTEFNQLLNDVYSEQTRTWALLSGKINHSLCLVGYMKSATV